MARPLETHEEAALNAAGELLRFGAQNTAEVPLDAVTAITDAFGARQSNAWDDAVAVKFWVAYNHLCSLIKPVTPETISAVTVPAARCRWFSFLRSKPVAQATANRYLIWLLSLLIAAVVLGFVVSTATSFKTEVQDLLTKLDQLSAPLQIKNEQLAKDDNDFSKGSDAQHAVEDMVTQHNRLTEQLAQKTRAMSTIISFGLRSAKVLPGSNERPHGVDDVRETLRNYYLMRDAVSVYVQSETLYAGIIATSILPILLGLMGACSYIVRLISDQIKDSSFSPTSPIRHRVRFALGGLAGVVIGYGGFHGSDSLSPSTLAFLAGYAVEPVFATFDSIAAKFRS
ncbi:hypothetical protein IF803_37410 [Bradyrhizobium sp. UFLA06-06]